MSADVAKAHPLFFIDLPKKFSQQASTRQAVAKTDESPGDGRDLPYPALLFRRTRYERTVKPEYHFDFDVHVCAAAFRLDPSSIKLFHRPCPPPPPPFTFRPGLFCFFYDLRFAQRVTCVADSSIQRETKQLKQHNSNKATRTTTPTKKKLEQRNSRSPMRTSQCMRRKSKR